MEIRKTKARFLSIFVIAALGVAFFAGIRATAPDMNLTADSFYDATDLMDIRILGTLGITQEDLDQLIEQLQFFSSVIHTLLYINKGAPPF